MTTRDLIQALPIHYKEYFESKFAIALLKQPNLFPAVKQVSNQICQIFKANSAAVTKLIQEQKTIQHELFGEKFFGRMHISENSDLTPQKIMDRMLAILEKHEDLSQIMQIHSIYLHRMHDAITHSTEMSSLKQKFYPEFLFKDRGRKSTSEKASSSQSVKLSKKLGIVRDTVFSTLIEEHKETHECAIDVFKPDPQSHFVTDMVKNNNPFGTGVSGHTVTFMLGAKKFAVDLQEYALATFAFLTAGGNHSFHEVMIVAKEMGVVYEVNNYACSLPETIRNSSAIEQLAQEFPEFIVADKLDTEVKESKKPRYEKILSRIGFIKTLHHELTQLFSGEASIAGKVLQYAV